MPTSAATGATTGIATGATTRATTATTLLVLVSGQWSVTCSGRPVIKRCWYVL